MLSSSGFVNNGAGSVILNEAIIGLIGVILGAVVSIIIFILGQRTEHKRAIRLANREQKIKIYEQLLRIMNEITNVCDEIRREYDSDLDHETDEGIQLKYMNLNKRIRDELQKIFDYMEDGLTVTYVYIPEKVQSQIWEISNSYSRTAMESIENKDYARERTMKIIDALMKEITAFMNLVKNDMNS